MRIAESVSVAAPAAAVWERIATPTRWPRDLGRMRCTHLNGTPEAGVGARYWLHIQVGAAEVGSLIEILEYEPHSAMSWTTIRGFEQRGHWRLRQRDDESIELTLSVSYQASGGLAALVTDELSSIYVSRYLREALQTLARRLQGTRVDSSAAGRAPLPRGAARALIQDVRLASALARAHLGSLARPDRYLGSLAAIARCGPTIAGRYQAAGALYPDAVAIVDERGALTFSQLQERVEALASALASNGIGAGESVAFMCRNHRYLLESILATCRLGADRLMIDTALEGKDLAELLARERPRGIIHDGDLSHRLSGAMRGRKRFIAWAERGGTQRHPTLETLIATADPSARAPLVGYDGRTISLTPSGNGTARHAMHRSPSTKALLSILDSIPLRAREPVFVAVPLSQPWILTVLGMASVLASTVVLRRELDAEATLASIHRERASCLVLETAMLQAILKLPRRLRNSHDTSSLRTVLVGDRPVPSALAERFTREYGEILYSVYATDATGWAAIAGPRELRRAPGTAGRPPRGTAVRVLDADAAPAPPGDTGRIFIAGEMLGDAKQHGTEVFDGAIFSGEMGHLDDHGRLFVEQPTERKPPRAGGRTRRSPSPNTPGRSPPTTG